VGYKEYYQSLYHLADIDYDDGITLVHHRALDKKRKSRYKNDKLPEVRRREAVARAVRIRENIRKEYTDKKAGRSYGSGCNDPASKAAAKEKNCKTKLKKHSCPHCGKLGHVTKRSRFCTFTTWKEQLKFGKSRQINVSTLM